MSALAILSSERRRTVAQTSRRRRLRAIASQQLQILATQTTSSQFQITDRVAASANNPDPKPTGPAVTVSHSMITTLEIIAFNTYATSLNTARISASLNAGTDYKVGTFAAGGFITGGISGRDSVLLGSRTDIGMPDEFVVQRAIAQRDKAWLPAYNAGLINPFENDNYGRASNVIPFSSEERRPMPPFVSHPAGGGNSEVVAELRTLRATVEKQGEELKKLHANIATATLRGADQAVRYIGEKLEEVVDEGSRRVAHEIRMKSRDNRGAGR